MCIIVLNCTRLNELNFYRDLSAKMQEILRHVVTNIQAAWCKERKCRIVSLYNATQRRRTASHCNTSHATRRRHKPRDTVVSHATELRRKSAKPVVSHTTQREITQHHDSTTAKRLTTREMSWCNFRIFINRDLEICEKGKIIIILHCYAAIFTTFNIDCYCSLLLNPDGMSKVFFYFVEVSNFTAFF